MQSHNKVREKKRINPLNKRALSSTENETSPHYFLYWLQFGTGKVPGKGSDCVIWGRKCNDNQQDRTGQGRAGLFSWQTACL